MFLQVIWSNLQQTSTSLQQSKKGPVKCWYHLFAGSTELLRQRGLEGLRLECADPRSRQLTPAATPFRAFPHSGPGRSSESGDRETREFLKETQGPRHVAAFPFTSLPELGVHEEQGRKTRCRKSLNILSEFSAVPQEENQSLGPAEGSHWPHITPKIELRWNKTYTHKAKP